MDELTQARNITNHISCFFFSVGNWDHCFGVLQYSSYPAQQPSFQMVNFLSRSYTWSNTLGPKKQRITTPLMLNDFKRVIENSCSTDDLQLYKQYDIWNVEWHTLWNVAIERTEDNIVIHNMWDVQFDLHQYRYNIDEHNDCDLHHLCVPTFAFLTMTCGTSSTSTSESRSLVCFCPAAKLGKLWRSNLFDTLVNTKIARTLW
jgi:hypothetical protein